MAHQTRIAVPITAADPPLVEQVRAARAAGADLVELRADLIGDISAIEALLQHPPELPVIVTVRSADEGGAWCGTDAERIALLERLGLLRPGFVDVEYTTWIRSANIQQKVGLVGEAGAQLGPASRPRNRLILSHHDTRATPATLADVFDRLEATPAEVLKTVFTARDATDALRVLAELRPRAMRRCWIALAMGEAGMCSRVLAAKYGAFLTFASLQRGRESAAGQPTIAELRDLYRWEQIGPGTAVYGVVGWPVAHSLGPAVHNAALAAAGIDGVYLPWPVGPSFEDLAAFMETVSALPDLGLAGLSVTVPHKEHALRWLDARGMPISDVARTCGAVNTLTLREGTWQGDNTDVWGVRASLPDACGVGRRADVLGAGGVARAVIIALGGLGYRVTVFNRNGARAQRLAQELRCTWRAWDQRHLGDGDILVNCTSVGMWPATAESPFPAEALRPGMLVLDTVYRPVETELVRAARAAGCRVVPGIEMFLHQAAAQFEQWHGTAAPLDVMREAARAAEGP